MKGLGFRISGLGGKPSLSWDMETCPDAPHVVFT